MTMSTTTILYYYVLPITGCCLVLAMASSPIKALLEREAKGDLGPLNPFPSTLFLMTNVVWVINGLLLADVYIFVINVLMVFVNGHITMRCYRMADQGRATQMEQILFIFSCVAMLFGFGFIYAVDQAKVVFAYGWMCAAFNMTVFVPPMLLMEQVIKKGNAEQINAPFAFVGGITTAFWCMYALLHSIFPLLIPNAFGCALSIVQILLTVIYPKDGGIPKEHTTMNDGNNVSKIPLKSPKTDVTENQVVELT